MHTPIVLLVGQAGSGKDTVASFMVKNHGAISIAHADPMKRLCALIFGFTEDQLWGSSDQRNGVDDRYYSDDAWVDARLKLQEHGPKWAREIFGSDEFMPALLAWFDELRRDMRGARYPDPVPGATWMEVKGGHVLVDNFHLGLVGGRTWRIKEDVRRGTRYAVTDIGGRKVRMHRLIAAAVDGQVVDHINGYGLDNRVDNLRHVTHSQNHGNQEKRRRGASTSKGVSFDRKRQKWVAKICVNHKTRNLGRFDSEAKAAQAYREEAVRVFGPYAIQNSRFGFTPRRALQTLGTELGRKISRSVWTDYTLRIAFELLGGQLRYDRTRGLVEDLEYAGPAMVVVTDGRFRNEIANVKRVGGVVIRIDSPSPSELSAGIKGHQSEAEQKSVPDLWFTRILRNDKTRGLKYLEGVVTDTLRHVGMASYR